MEGKARTFRSTFMLNVKHVKAYILKCIGETRPGWPCNRVSREYVDMLDMRVRRMIREDVHRHRSVGKTFNP